ncbi:MAG: glycosyltransferase [Rickettsia endosymbiont of Ixodes persulcatus]|nr:glycosyltransferase [Rickettsia endosymbiont of Ixodes persulcatus]MCZ6901867.1 glycosyltransferase [Rickettsia endosymbiont of Ixodes persulcatus]MCZ6903581.1 glycosyltransferase [Rickettsia endosymbiont of Ixodes persulcatus]MCZ6908782.1 glycosyltransferase [Rickettsia endosymbiont of Ixodes persulcatus]MCZ6910202.1 glycosyltransferase [Rickettsia endosymbiont of Ixodes persulcatus]
MKILLLTDIPPCENYTAGLVLYPLVKFLPLDQIVICSVANPTLEFKIPKELKEIPHLKLFKPIESARRHKEGKIGDLIAYSFELFNAAKVKYFLLPKIIKFAKEQQVDAIWVVLQGQTIIRLTRPLAKKLTVSLFTQIWDPFEWWLRANKIYGFTQKRLLKEFDEVIKHSTCCATASWAMSESYKAKYNISTIPVIAGLPKEFARLLSTSYRDDSEFIISMAGQFYAQAEWLSLISALNQANWIIAGRKIKVRVMGGCFQAFTQSSANFEYLGWRSQEETIRLLTESDLLYMPYWFSEEFYKESSTSFPSKLVTYFASGRPVFCHAPDYSSPSKYIAENNAGYLCNSLAADKIIYELEKVITDEDSYKKFAKNGSECFFRDFTLDCMKDAFFKFLGLKS